MEALSLEDDIDWWFNVSEWLHPLVQQAEASDEHRGNPQTLAISREALLCADAIANLLSLDAEGPSARLGQQQLAALADQAWSLGGALEDALWSPTTEPPTGGARRRRRRRRT